MSRRHICHLVHRFDVGGLESVLVELIHRLPVERYQHTVVALTEITDFSQRVNAQDVAFYALNKQPGKDLGVWWRLYTLLRQIKPDVVHSCNLATIEGQLPAWLAGVPRRIHAEHGRDSYDLEGRNPKYRLLRRLLNPLIHHWVPVSRDLARWLEGPLKISAHKVRPISNGVDLDRFHPDQADRALLERLGGWSGADTIALCVGRLWPVKDQANLLNALKILKDQGVLGAFKLALVGDGPERQRLENQVNRFHLETAVQFLGTHEDVAPLVAAADLFVLPSLAEGTPLTVLEAMACGAPIVASAVGGVPDLVKGDQYGTLVPPGDAHALATALQAYIEQPRAALRQTQGVLCRQWAEQHFGWPKAVDAYDQLFG
ncbi:TIGR03088 family PEP-CTERM/XrtA system glycosyltransferase [Magnetococcus sp. PR-3]|uniref:TIGR03088 family PEP-CTERM/XrtA system glycosyltransferase n=1 Tax=Magnetococcus sp. PR-3 TaxID=3120355 RepID=UPI002FCE13D2